MREENTMQTTTPTFPPSARDSVAGAPHKEETLVALYGRTVDSVKGYAKMVEKAEPSFRDIAEKFRALHARHADLLARKLADRGIDASPDSTIMGTVNQAVDAFRAFFDDIDEDVMDQVRSGEDWVLKSFDTAIAAHEGDSLAHSLRDMREDVVALLDQTRQIG